MIKINAIKIEVNTNSGLFGAEYEFTDGFNIIRGDNTSGKSSLFQSILYCLGFEELIGGKNEKTMQSVPKDIVEYPKGTSHRVLQSDRQTGRATPHDRQKSALAATTFTHSTGTGKARVEHHVFQGVATCKN